MRTWCISVCSFLSVVAVSAVSLAAELDPWLRPDPKLVRPEDLAARLENGSDIPVVIRIRIPNETAVLAALSEPKSRKRAKAAINRRLDEFLATLELGARKPLKLTTTPRVALPLSVAEITALLSHPSVAEIKYDPQAKKTLGRTMGSAEINVLHTRGLTGAGSSIVIIDDGVESSHPFLGAGARTLSQFEACFRAEAPYCANGNAEHIAAGAGESNGGAAHGTAVAGVAVGENPVATLAPESGVARGANYIPINVFRSGAAGATASFSSIDRALEYVEDEILNATVFLPTGIKAVNISIGGSLHVSSCDRHYSTTRDIVERLRKLQVAIVAGAGNSYIPEAMSAPACIGAVTSVGATNRYSPLSISLYSNVSGSTDFLAPGGEDDATGCINTSFGNGTYGLGCGTSLAGPHVAGLITLFRDHYASSFTLGQIEFAMNEAGSIIDDQRIGVTGNVVGVYSFPFINGRDTDNLLAAAAQSPVSNDRFSDAITIDYGVVYTSSNAFATLQASETPPVVSTADRTVWFKFTPNQTTWTRIDLEGSDFDTVLGVYTGPRVGALSAPVATNDNGLIGAQTSFVSFEAVAGQIYRVVVAGKTIADEGRIVLKMTSPPRNDDFSDRETIDVIDGFTSVRFSTTEAATFQSNEQILHGWPTPKATVWYRFTPPSSGRYSIRLSGNTLADSVLGLYEDAGRIANLNLIESADGGALNFGSLIERNLSAGVTYALQVSNYGDDLTDTVEPVDSGSLSSAPQVYRGPQQGTFTLSIEKIP